jgi:hypothetical protein
VAESRFFLRRRSSTIATIELSENPVTSRALSGSHPSGMSEEIYGNLGLD